MVGRLSYASRPATITELLAAGDRPLVLLRAVPAQGRRSGSGLWETVRRLEALGPDFVSVTYGASGSTRDRTIDMTEAIAEHTTLRTMAHLTCASQSPGPVAPGHRLVRRRRHPAHPGHPGRHAGGPTEPWVRHPEGLANATELVELVRELGDFCVGVAAFPDLHPERQDADLDARLLVEKQRAGAWFAITQLFFTAAATSSWSTGSARSAPTCRSSPASCRSPG